MDIKVEKRGLSARRLSAECVQTLAACCDQPVGPTTPPTIIRRQTIQLPPGSKVISSECVTIPTGDCCGESPNPTGSGMRLVRQTVRVPKWLVANAPSCEVVLPNCTTACRDPIPCSDPETFPTFLQVTECWEGIDIYGAPRIRTYDLVRVSERVWESTGCPVIRLRLSESCQFFLEGSRTGSKLVTEQGTGDPIIYHGSESSSDGVRRVLTEFPGFDPTTFLTPIEDDATAPNVWGQVGRPSTFVAARRTTLGGTISTSGRWVGEAVLTTGGVGQSVRIDLRKVGGEYRLFTLSYGDTDQMVTNLQAGTFPYYSVGTPEVSPAGAYRFSFANMGPPVNAADDIVLIPHSFGDTFWSDPWLPSVSVHTWNNPYFCFKDDPESGTSFTFTPSSGIILTGTSTYTTVEIRDGSTLLDTVEIGFSPVFAFGSPVTDSTLLIDYGSGFVSYTSPELVENLSDGTAKLIYTVSYGGGSFLVEVFL